MREIDSLKRTSSHGLDAFSLSIELQMCTKWQHLGDKGVLEGNWPPYLNTLMALNECPHNQVLPNVQNRVLDYLVFFIRLMMQGKSSSQPDTLSVKCADKTA